MIAASSADGAGCQKRIEAKYPGLYEQLILDGTLHTHLADADKRASDMMAQLVDQMAKQEHITKHLKAEQPMVWGGRINSINCQAIHFLVYEDENCALCKVDKLVLKTKPKLL